MGWVLTELVVTATARELVSYVVSCLDPVSPPRPETSRRARRWRIAGGVAVALLLLTSSVVIAVVVFLRIDTGTWEVPDTDDFVRVVTGGRSEPARIIYLERAPVELRPGVDDAPSGTSSVLASARNQPTRVPGWKGSAAGWRNLVTCVRGLFAPFNVTVTDQRPDSDDFVLVVVGGKPRDIGVKNPRVGGLAPFNGQVISRPVVFAFSAALAHRKQLICETIGMEVAHAYGLDHSRDCKDVMTYMPDCGPKRFVDKDLKCGEKKARPCEGGKATQNSYRHLLSLLGPAPHH